MAKTEDLLLIMAMEVFQSSNKEKTNAVVQEDSCLLAEKSDHTYYEAHNHREHMNTLFQTDRNHLCKSNSTLLFYSCCKVLYRYAHLVLL